MRALPWVPTRLLPSLLALLLGLQGCSSDDASPAGAVAGTAGNAGASGTAGASGAGGASGTGGSAATAASAGTAGTGGDAGAAGKGGTGGTGGSGAVTCGSEQSTPDLSCGALAWSVSPVLSRKRNHHTTHAFHTQAGAFLYVIGGFNGSTGTYKFVDRAPIAADGSLGAFIDDTPLPIAVGGHVSMKVGDTLVVAGGMTSAATTATTHLAHVNDDGSLGAWAAGNNLAHPRMHAGSFVLGSDVYVVGGFQNNTVWDDIQRATLQPDGTLSAWTPAGTLPGPRSHFSITLIDGYVFLTGGLAKSALTNPPNLKDVVRARIDADGSLVEWTDMPALPSGLATHAAFFYGGYLYIGGGIDDVPLQSKVMLRAPMGADHTLGAWEATTSLPEARSHVHQMPLLDDHVYSVSGSIDFNLNSTEKIVIGGFE